LWSEGRSRAVNVEDAVKTAVGFIVIIVIGSLLSALVGGAFGALVATISPEFVTELFSPKAEQGIVRYAFAVGMIWGVFLGAAVSGFACFLAAVLKILRIRFEYRKEREAGITP
jgi:MFS family permease